MSKDSRAGGKFCGSHTTLIPAAAIVADIASASPHVTKISLGFIKAGLRSVSGKRRVKIADDGKSILLSVRDTASHQELRIFASNLEGAKQAIAKGVHGAGIVVVHRDGE